MLVAVTIVICSSLLLSTLFYLSKKHTLLDQEKEKTKEEKIENYIGKLLLENFIKYILLLTPLFAIILSLLVFWGYEIFNWLIRL